MIDPQTRQGTARIQCVFIRAEPRRLWHGADPQRHRLAPRLPEIRGADRQQGPFVYIVDPNGKVVRRDVKTGDVTDAGMVILSGLQAANKSSCRPAPS